MRRPTKGLYGAHPKTTKGERNDPRGMNVGLQNGPVEGIQR